MRQVTQPTFTVDVLDFKLTLKELTQQEWEDLMLKFGTSENSESKSYLQKLVSIVRSNKNAVLPYILKIERLDGTTIEGSVEQIINKMSRANAKQVLDKVSEQLVLSEEQVKNSSSSLEQSTAASAGSVETPVEKANESASISQAL